MAAIILGATYKDRVTGFQGLAIGYVKYLTGCNQVLTQPRAKEKRACWIDEQQLERVLGWRVFEEELKNQKEEGK